METFTIKTFNPDVPAAKPVAFYLLSRGRGAGKPRFQPWRNSYAFFCEPQDAVQYYLYIRSMWEAKVFREYLTPSGPPYITVEDMYYAINTTMAVFNGIDEYIERFYLLLIEGTTVTFKTRLLDALKLALLHKA